MLLLVDQVRMDELLHVRPDPEKATPLRSCVLFAYPNASHSEQAVRGFGTGEARCQRHIR